MIVDTRQGPDLIDGRICEFTGIDEEQGKIPLDQYRELTPASLPPEIPFAIGCLAVSPDGTTHSWNKDGNPRILRGEISGRPASVSFDPRQGLLTRASRGLLHLVNRDKPPVAKFTLRANAESIPIRLA